MPDSIDNLVYKVLVVDDSDAWFAAVAAECKRIGYRAVRALDQDQALDAVRDEQPSLVVVDVLLAARAGAGFIRQLRSLPHMKKTPLMLATLGISPKTAGNALGGTSESVVSKDPHALHHLTDRLRKLPVSG